jgi:hypothetical protein
MDTPACAVKVSFWLSYSSTAWHPELLVATKKIFWLSVWRNCFPVQGHVTRLWERSVRYSGTFPLYRSARLCLRSGLFCIIIKEMPVSCIRAHLLHETKMLHRQPYLLKHNSLERGSSLRLAGVSDERPAQNFASIYELRINRSLVLTISLCDKTFRTPDFATRRSVKLARCFDALVTVQSPTSLQRN